MGLKILLNTFTRTGSRKLDDPSVAISIAAKDT